MFNNYATQEYHAKQRHEESIAAAEQYRLARHCQTEQATLSSQILAGIGDVLVEVGSRLQEQRPKTADVIRQPSLDTL